MKEMGLTMENCEKGLAVALKREEARQAEMCRLQQFGELIGRANQLTKAFPKDAARTMQSLELLKAFLGRKVGMDEFRCGIERMESELHSRQEDGAADHSGDVNRG